MNPTAALTAGDLADLFNDLSQAIDDFRLSDRVPPDTPPLVLGRLKDEAQALEDRAHQLTAESMAATLAGIQGNLQKIKTATEEAQAQLAHLNDVSKAINIATAGVALGAAIATGNVPSIAATAEALAQAVL